MHEIPDIDLDVKERDKTASLFPKAVIASQLTTDKKHLTKHNSGIYFQQIPVIPNTRLAAFPYKQAEKDFGFFKVDLLANHVYDLIESQEELDRLLAEPVDWSWFQDHRFFEKGLFHLGGKWEFLCQKYPPQSIQDVAALLNLKTPAKAYLYEESRSWDDVRALIWKKEESGKYSFKKSHAVGYAIVTTLHAKLMARHFKTDEWEQ